MGTWCVCVCIHAHAHTPYLKAVNSECQCTNPCYLTDVRADAGLPESLAAELHCHLAAHGVLLTDLLKSFLPNKELLINGSEADGDSNHPKNTHTHTTPPYSHATLNPFSFTLRSQVAYAARVDSITANGGIAIGQLGPASDEVITGVNPRYKGDHLPP